MLSGRIQIRKPPSTASRSRTSRNEQCSCLYRSGGWMYKQKGHRLPSGGLRTKGLTRRWLTSGKLFLQLRPKTVGKEMGKVAAPREVPSVLFAWKLLKRLAPQVGFEPTTLRLTAERLLVAAHLKTRDLDAVQARASENWGDSGGISCWMAFGLYWTTTTAEAGATCCRRSPSALRFSSASR
jgi:hypothetical protein